MPSPPSQRSTQGLPSSSTAPRSIHGHLVFETAGSDPAACRISCTSLRRVTERAGTNRLQTSSYVVGRVATILLTSHHYEHLECPTHWTPRAPSDKDLGVGTSSRWRDGDLPVVT